MYMPKHLARKNSTLGGFRKIGDIQEVPNIESLNKQVETYMLGLKPTFPTKSCGSWNIIFQQLITECDVQSHFPIDILLTNQVTLVDITFMWNWRRLPVAPWSSQCWNRWKTKAQQTLYGQLLLSYMPSLSVILYGT